MLVPKLTKRVVDGLRADPARDVFAWERELRGFGIRVKPSGVASYLIQYRNTEGRTRRLVLARVGTLAPEQARGMAREKLAAVAKGADPSQERNAEKTAMTVKELCEHYLASGEKGLILGKGKKPKKASTLATDRSRINRHILPLLGHRKLKNLTRADLAQFVRDVTVGKTAADEKTGFRGRSIVKGGAGAAARTLGLLGGILSYAENELGVISQNPRRGVSRQADGKRNRRMTRADYAALGSALVAAEADGENRAAINAVRLLAYTGCRRGEVVSLKWSEVDLAGQCLRLSETKEGASIRPLGSPACDLLRSLDRTGAYVLPGRDGGKPYGGLPKAFKRLAAKAQLDWLTPHLLRHSFASVADERGFTEPTIAAMLGHSSGSVTRRYIHKLDGVLISAADNVAREIQRQMIGAPTAMVVQLAGMRA